MANQKITQRKKNARKKKTREKLVKKKARTREQRSMENILRKMEWQTRERLEPYVKPKEEEVDED